MRYIIGVIILLVGLQAISTSEIKLKIQTLKKTKSYKFKEINVPYDPFYKSQKIIKSKKSTHAKHTQQRPALILLTVLNSKAFINQRWYKKDDIVAGFRIISIFNDYVILKKGKRKVILKLKQDKKILKIVEKNI